MRKNTLIKLLQEMPGNPEVMLWNGMVGDWMPLDKPVESRLVKINKNYFIETCRLEKCVESNNFDYQLSPQEIEKYKKSYKNSQDWEDDPFVTGEDFEKKHYLKKRVIYIQGKVRGVSTFDRLGGIKY